MEVSTEKSKIMTNSTNNISAEISMNNQKLEEVTGSSTWEQPYARMPPAQQQSAPEWQQWPDKTGSAGATPPASQASSSCTSLLSPSSSSVAVKHGPCLLALEKKDPSFQIQVAEETSSHFLFGVQDQRLSAEQDQFSCGSTGTSFGNCQEMETCMILACHTPRQLLHNHPSEHLGWWATP